jgi:putative phosphoesterase
MRLAALYDIHGNLPALEAVLPEVRAEGVDLIVVGGDVVAGPLPVETLARLQAECADIPVQFIRGNAESELLRCVAGQAIGGLSERANDEARWLAAYLPANLIQFIAEWPATLTYEIEGETVLFCHATPHNDIDVFTRLTPDEKLRPIFDGLEASLVVCGHTHMQFELTVGQVRIVNAGSVGMPFGHTGVDWLLFDGTVQLRHTEYDLSEAAKRIQQSNYPQAESFAANNVLQAPAETAAMAMLANLEARQAWWR